MRALTRSAARATRPVLWAVGMTAMLVGCVPPPQYSSTPTIGATQQTAPTQYVRLAVVADGNYAKSLTYLTGVENTRRDWGANFSGPHALTDRLTAMLSQHFSSVMQVGNAEAARKRGADMILVLDAKVDVGSLSFEHTSVALTGTFTTLDGQTIDTISGKSSHMVPWPNTGPHFAETASDAVAALGKAIDNSSLLLAAAQPYMRAAKSRTTQTATAPAAAPAPAGLPDQAPAIAFAQVRPQPNDVAVIIGNADYTKFGNGIPNVTPAYDDALGMRLYAERRLGIRPGNIIFLKDATGAQMTRVFGSSNDAQGQLYDWIKPGVSRVFVYYAGHGAPSLTPDGSPYLVPSDADPARIDLNGYPVRQLYDNLSKLPAAKVTVVLEACFSGISQGGAVVAKASPIFLSVKAPPVPSHLTVITAGAANQEASWATDDSDGLFTKYFLEGMSGKADAPPYGNGDGKVTLDELGRYLKATVTYYARRYYGRDQDVQIVRATP